jgi:hypothetical protein
MVHPKLYLTRKYSNLPIVYVLLALICSMARKSMNQIVNSLGNYGLPFIIPPRYESKDNVHKLWTAAFSILRLE